MSAELLLGVGFGGNKGMLGGGFDFGAMFNYAGSYYRERNVEHSLTYEEYAGRTMVVTSAVPVVVYEYDVYVPEFTITQEYLDEYNKHVDPSKRWGKEKVGTQAGNTHVTCKIDNTYDATLGLITLDDYNKAAANVGSADVPTIDMDNVLQHTQGDPTTYPTQTSQIANVRNNAILSTTNAVPVTADRGTETSASITVTDTTQFTNGFDITVSADLSMNVHAEDSVVYTMSVSGQAGVKGELSAGASWVSSKTQGTEFSTTLPSLHPLSYLANGGNEYSYGVPWRRIRWSSVMWSKEQGRALRRRACRATPWRTARTRPASSGPGATTPPVPHKRTAWRCPRAPAAGRCLPAT